MTQEQMAAMIGVTQPQVSALMRGWWEGMDLLSALLTLLGSGDRSGELRG